MWGLALPDAPRFSKSERLRKSSWLILLAILTLAAALRVAGLGSESLWLDETTSLILAQNPPAQLVALTAADIHPPLYYLLLRVWLVFGTSEAALRSLSVALGVLTVLALYDLGRQLFGRRVGLLAALFLAVAPLHVWYSQETRMYALATLWAVVSTALLARAWRAGGRLVWVGYVAAVALGMYTHYYMGFVVLAQNICVGFLWLRGRLGRGFLLRWIVAQVAWLILFAPWIPTVARQIAGGGGGWVEQAVGRPGLRALADVFIAYALGTLRGDFPEWARRVAYGVYGIALLTALWAMARPARRPARPWSPAEAGAVVIGLCFVPLGITWAAAQTRPIFALRYLLPFLPAFCLLLASGVHRLAQWKLAAGAALALLLIGPALWGCWLQVVTPEKDDWRGLTARLAREAGAGDVILPEPFWNAKPLRYYAGQRLVIDDGAPLPATSAGVAEAVGRATAGGTRSFWLIENVGHYGDPGRLLAGYLRAHCVEEASFAYPGIGEATHFVCDGK